LTTITFKISILREMLGVPMQASTVSLACLTNRCNHKPFCPLQVKFAANARVNLLAKQDYFGEAPNVFVGKHGYPNLNVGFLNVEEYKDHDDPLLWSRNKFSIDRIFGLRSELVNSSFKAQVNDVRSVTNSMASKLLQMGREVALAEKPVEMEVHLSKKPHLSFSFEQNAAPHGPQALLKSIAITANPKISHQAEKIADATDLRAGEALTTLADKGFDEHYLSRLLSIGTLGVKTQRKIVPTRWSITAVDDTLGKQAISEIKDYPSTDYQAFFGSHLGNYYLVLMFPDIWSYELFETYIGDPNSVEHKHGGWSTDHEFFEGRKEYADSTAGGYYAARLAILERLKLMKRQASALCLRFITNEYWAPLGVWVVREAVRNAMGGKPMAFGSKDLMLEYARQLVKKKFGYEVESQLRESMLLREQKRQRKLSAYL